MAEKVNLDTINYIQYGNDKGKDIILFTWLGVKILK